MTTHPALQMDDVHAELLIRVSAAICVCGAPKMRGTRLFCEPCRVRINCVCPRLYLQAFHEFRAEHIRRALVLYDIMCDLLQKPASKEDLHAH